MVGDPGHGPMRLLAMFQWPTMGWNFLRTLSASKAEHCGSGPCGGRIFFIVSFKDQVRAFRTPLETDKNDSLNTTAICSCIHESCI